MGTYRNIYRYVYIKGLANIFIFLFFKSFDTGLEIRKCSKQTQKQPPPKKPSPPHPTLPRKNPSMINVHQKYER